MDTTIPIPGTDPEQRSGNGGQHFFYNTNTIKIYTLFLIIHIFPILV